MNTLKNNPKLGSLLLLLTFAAAFYVRAKYLTAGLEYDEIWSLENFANLPAGELFTRLALPNNQPLNSLFIKLAVAGELPLWGIRLHSLLAGLLTLPLTGFICYVLSGGKKAAALWSMVFMALSVPDATYSVLARGYALQVFFLSLYGAGIASCGRWRPQHKYLAFLPETAVLLGGMGAILTVPTSVMYLAAITLTALLIRPGKPGKALLAVMICGVVFTLIYYLGNYEQLNQARVWGTKITGAASYFAFVKEVTGKLITPAGAVMAFFALCCSPGRRAPLLLIFILPLAAAAVTNAGPARTYLPFCAATALLAGCGASDLAALIKKETLKAPAAILLTAVLCGEYFWYLPDWRMPDWCQIFQAASKEKNHVLVVHRATSGYPLAWNNRPKVYTDFVNRLLDRSPRRELLMFDGPGRINGTSSNGGESVICTPVAGTPANIAGIKCRRYKLVETTALPPPGTVVFAAIRPLRKEVHDLILAQLRESRIKWLQLNSWLSCPINRPEATYRYTLLAGTVEEDSKADWMEWSKKNLLSVYVTAER